MIRNFSGMSRLTFSKNVILCLKMMTKINLHHKWNVKKWRKNVLKSIINEQKKRKKIWSFFKHASLRKGYKLNKLTEGRIEKINVKKQRFSGAAEILAAKINNHGDGNDDDD